MSNQSNTKTSRGKLIIFTMLSFMVLVWGFPMHCHAVDDKEQLNNEIMAFQNKSIKLKAKKYKKINTKIYWSKVTGGVRYEIWIKTQNSSQFKHFRTTRYNYSIIHKKFKMGYKIKVRAYKIVGKEKIYTRWSNTVNIKSLVKRHFAVRAYAYHESNGICANGQSCKVGRIATDPSVIPTGSWLYVNGYGLCKACDTGGDIHGRIVDLYMNSESACNRWGVRYPQVYILR
jgi:3D (Asp-Asp-Asp) domain-containing protein